MLDSSFLPLTDGVRSIRLVAVQDIERYLAGTQDPLVQRFGYLPVSEPTRHAVVEIVDTHAPEGMRRGDLGLLSIVDEHDKFLGSLVLFNVTRENGEVGLWLLPEGRGVGHGLGALQLATKFAKQCGLTELTARTVVDNYSSKHAIERAGFQEVARGTDKTPSGEEAPHVYYRIRLRS